MFTILVELFHISNMILREGPCKASLSYLVVVKESVFILFILIIFKKINPDILSFALFTHH